MYSSKKAKEVGKSLNLTPEETPKEQMQKMLDLPKEDFRQLLIGMLSGDV